MSDYSNVIQGMFSNGPKAQVAANINVNPDDSARAYELEKATGVPSSIISGDMESFEAQHKAAVAGDIVSGNPYIGEYVNSHPLASQVSNDDYGQLDTISQHLQSLQNSTSTALGPLRGMLGGVRGVISSLGDAFTHGGDNVPTDNRLRYSLEAGLNTATALGSSLISAPLTFLHDFAQASGGDEAGDVAGALGEGFMAGGTNVHGPEMEALDRASLWLRSGKVPPNGVHPLIDKAKLEANQSALDILDQAVKESQSSTTKERAPDLFANFVEQHIQDKRMGISGQRALELYGDKVPAPDDGILGWVPDIDKQLAVARDTGADISVPMKDWIANVDPAVHKELADDLRVVDDGITNREATEALPPVPSIDEAVPTLRNNASLEPLFSIGDRKLTLQRMQDTSKVGSTVPTVRFGIEDGFHDFDMVNENGQSVGTINLSEQKGGKELYVDNINGLGDYFHPNNFGPALMRDLLRQIKVAFPDAETLTGHRVSGARGEAGTYDLPSAMPKIRLDDPGADFVGAHDKFSTLLGGAWHSIGSGVEAYVKPTELYQEHEQDLKAAVTDELNRVVPQGVIHAPVSEMRRGAQRGPQGLYFPYEKPIILWSMNADDAIGTARHEAIHHLYRAGFFDNGEWDTLKKAAADEGWMDKFNIHDRYTKLSEDGKIEESIADAYKNWANEFELRQRQPGFQLSPVDRIFQRIKDFLTKIAEHVRRITGSQTAEDLFQQVHSGEIGSREVEGGAQGEVAAQERPISEPGQGIDVRSPFQGARDVGMTIDQHKNYMKLIEARQQADLRASTERVRAEQTKRQSDEWKAQGEAMRPQVLSDLNARPDIAADKFFGLGELMGQKLDKTYRLDWDSLTPEQRKAIPESYTVRKGGVKPDDVASLFGYPTGDAMIEGLSRVTQARDLSGLRRDRFQRKMVDNEIQRRMETEHGFLAKNIAEDTKDQVLSENQLDLLHEETTHLAMMSGEQGTGLTRDQLTSAIKDKFDALPTGSVSSDKYLREAGKQGRIAELALLQQKPADAYKAKQVQYHNAIYADMARRVEKAKAQLDKAAKPFRKQDVAKIEPEYLNHIQDLLQQAGYKVGRSQDNIAENLSRRGKTLEQFANEKLSESFGYRDIPIADVIVDKAVKPVDQMSTHDFLGFKQTVDALIKNAKDEQKIIREGATADRKEVLDEMKEHIERFPLRENNASASRWDKIKELPRSFISTLTSVQTFLDRMGNRDPNSVFNCYITYPLASAANRKSALQREFSKLYRDIGEVEDKDKLIASPLIDPLSGRPFSNFTRGNVAQMLHNAGNKSNWTVLAKGYGADPEKLMNWLVANTRPEDWTRAQALGKNVFGKLIKLADQEYEHIHGITIDKIPLERFENVHGSFEGWYHPLIKDPIREGKSPIRDGAYDDSDFGHITTANGYTKKRSGAAYPLDLNPDMTPVRINQMIHDISFRGPVLETQKIFKDPGLSNAITAHYGAEYNSRNMLIPYLKGIAGEASVPSKALGKMAQMSEWMRQNVIGTYIGFNPSTAMKHGPTALVMSMREVGVGNYLRAVKDLYGRSPDLALSNSEFVMQHSEEIQRRERHFQDTLFGAHNEIARANSFREQVLEKGSWLVAKSDMISAKPMWLAAYRNAQDDGLTHGESIEQADRSVRRAHGSTAVTSLPSMVTGGGELNKWMTSLYGFFGNNMQRRIELAQDIKDTFNLAVKQGELNKAAANISSILTDTFSYVIWPTVVEELVTGTATDDHRGLGRHLLDASLTGLASTVPYLRDIVNGLISGNDPSVGLISSLYHDVVKGVKEDFRTDALTKQRMGKTVGDTLTALGHTTGMAPKTLDNAAHFGIDLVNGAAHPHSAGDWLRGITKGTTKERVEK